MAKPRTLYDKIWDDHVVDTQPDGTCLIYIDRHLVHEVTSPQAFEGLRMTGRKVRHPETGPWKGSQAARAGAPVVVGRWVNWTAPTAGRSGPTTGSWSGTSCAGPC